MLLKLVAIEGPEIRFIRAIRAGHTEKRFTYCMTITMWKMMYKILFPNRGKARCTTEFK